MHLFSFKPISSWLYLLRPNGERGETVNTTLLFLSMLQVGFAGVIAVYFVQQIKHQQRHRVTIDRDSVREMEKLKALRAVSLTEPLAEKARPMKLSDIVGQEEGLRALRATLCGPNPQHVIIYGPPGVGKTAAARVVLEEAKRMTYSPFRQEAVFCEMDATTARFDERGIADPLIGSVHDPIYQGAGSMGVAGIPQPKPGAVTKAHGGILFIDEIGELHPIQINKLLKVLEDRKVFFESAYYNQDDANIPQHIHDIFQNGLPADFRLVGATTRNPEDLPPAIRSRCIEVFFRPLVPDEITEIVRKAAKKVQLQMTEAAVMAVKRYATNGRDAVNMVQLSAGIAMVENRLEIDEADVEWVAESSQLPPRPEKHIGTESQVGVVNGLAVIGPMSGILLEIEAVARKSLVAGHGKVSVTGAVEEEEINGGKRVIKRRSMVMGSLDNAMTALKNIVPVHLQDYDIHLNFPGGIPVDGPSAGISMAIAIYSAVVEVPIDHQVAMTGEVSLKGDVKPVGGILAKLDAARRSGVKRVILSAEQVERNMSSLGAGLEVHFVHKLEDAIALAVTKEPATSAKEKQVPLVPIAPTAIAQGGIC